MNRPEAASDQSMDDILANIRKLIAEEPAAARAPLEPRARPLDVRPKADPASAAATAPQTVLQTGPQATPQTAPHAAPGASLSRALNGLPPTPVTDQPTAVPLEDLADLLEEVPASPLRPQAPEPGSAGAVPPMSSIPPASHSVSPAPALPGVVKEAAVTPLSFEELLRGRADPGAPIARPVPAALSPASAADPASPSGDLGAFVPQRPGAGSAAPPFGSSLVSDSKPTGASGVAASPLQAAPEVKAASSTLAGGGREAGVDPFTWPGPRLNEAPRAAAPAAEPPAVKANMASGANAGYEVIAAMPPLRPRVPAAAAGPVASSDAVTAGSGFEAAAIESTAAAASALGALAAGLAASSKSFGAKPAGPPANATAAAEPPVPAEAAPAPSEKAVAQVPVAAERASPQAGGETRTLEDTVAELLRPMLREWLQENMPRIVEKALKIEIAEGVKPASKPQGP